MVILTKILLNVIVKIVIKNTSVKFDALLIVNLFLFFFQKEALGSERVKIYNLTVNVYFIQLYTLEISSLNEINYFLTLF